MSIKSKLTARDIFEIACNHPEELIGKVFVFDYSAPKGDNNYEESSISGSIVGIEIHKDAEHNADCPELHVSTKLMFNFPIKFLTMGPKSKKWEVCLYPYNLTYEIEPNTKNPPEYRPTYIEEGDLTIYL